MNAKAVARAGVLAALLTVSAAITVPIGLVPFTLQTLVLSMIPAVADRRTALLAVGSYVLLGALGMPVFSGFMGGVGVLASFTCGFLWGFFVGIALATTLMRALPERVPLLTRVIIADALLMLVSYTCGTIQLMVVGSMGLVPALTIAVIPFVVSDAVKVAVGAKLGCSVARAIHLSAR